MNAMTTLTLDQQDLAVLSEALGRMPYAQVAPLVQKINHQIHAQETKPEPASAPEKAVMQ